MKRTQANIRLVAHKTVELYCENLFRLDRPPISEQKKRQAIKRYVDLFSSNEEMFKNAYKELIDKGVLTYH